jgi:hypothetical protein
MRQTLRLHPDSTCLAVTHIEVEVHRRRANTLAFSYILTGAISDLALPSVVTATRTDELWRHTCFEAFLARSSTAEYYEFNFAPSTQWAAYRFSGYRTDMRAVVESNTPQITVESTSEHLILRASLDLPALLFRESTLRLGLSAVIEETSGRRSYWALAHPPGKPDFHHSDCFALELA